MKELLLSPFGLIFPFITYFVFGMLMVWVAALIDFITNGKNGLLEQLEFDAKYGIC